MKRYLVLALLVLMLLCGCTTAEEPSPGVSTPPPVVTSVQSPASPPDEPSAEPSSEITPTPEPSPEVSKDPELHFQTTTSYDLETGIRRTTLDPQGYHLSLYFEVPVFEEAGEGCQKINEFFDGLEQQFFTPENEALIHAWESTVETGMPITEEFPFFYERNAWINSHTDKLVSVTIDYHWMMGGVNDRGSDSYTFRTDTGELVRLTDLLDGTEEELRELIYISLRQKEQEHYYYPTVSEAEYFKDYALDDFEFCVVEDKIVICFDKNEASLGSTDFAVELPITINPKF